jgi:UDP-glucose 4-epimerase
MSNTLAWVLGGGGLLGFNVLQAMKQHRFGIEPWRLGSSGIPWRNPVQGQQVLEAQTLEFVREVNNRGCSWAVLWCAGSGAVGSSNESLRVETDYLNCLLHALGKQLPQHRGKVLLVSSAGGVYGNNLKQPLTEKSSCQPISDYGRNKLLQESMLQEWVKEHPEISTLVARISNLYGPAPQINTVHGLIPHISRSILHRVPINIFVPLDTSRDYIYVDDCVSSLLEGLSRLGETGREHVLKIFHSGETKTIAGLIGVFSRLTHGRVRIICATSPIASQQSLQLQFRSTVWEDLMPEQSISLTIGIQRVHAHMLSIFQNGRLPPMR